MMNWADAEALFPGCSIAWDVVQSTHGDQLEVTLEAYQTFNEIVNGRNVKGPIRLVAESIHPRAIWVGEYFGSDGEYHDRYDEYIDEWEYRPETESWSHSTTDARHRW